MQKQKIFQRMLLPTQKRAPEKSSSSSTSRRNGYRTRFCTRVDSSLGESGADNDKTPREWKGAKMHFNLFVYGTLQPGGSAAGLLAGCEHTQDASVGGILYNIDDEYPALVVYGNSQVRGQVWRCPTERLKSLDNYEGVDAGLFRRIGLEVHTDDGRVIPCWSYVAGPKLTRKLTEDRRIASWNLITR
jgi:gamma-glutamylcyclotransferase (GGCT)/AIG2-like uncharacterized protein YtfP